MLNWTYMWTNGEEMTECKLIIDTPITLYIYQVRTDRPFTNEDSIINFNVQVINKNLHSKHSTW